MKTLLNFITFCLSIVVPWDSDAMANTGYVPMIREDRVWEYRGNSMNNGEMGNAFHYMKFDGMQEVLGKEYHRFVLFKSVYTDEEGNLMTAENRHSPSYLVREEEGKVYVLCDDDRIVTDFDATSMSTDKLSDFNIYDYTVADNSEISFPAYASQSIGSLETYTVKWLPATDIQGESCRVMTFYGGTIAEGLRFIEGIGATCNGSLASFNIDNVSQMWDNHNEPGFQSTLNRVFDGEGNVIYQDENMVIPPAPTYVPMIREDRVWEYTGTFLSPEACGTVFHYMKFDGTMDVQGTEYHRFVLFRSIFESDGEYIKGDERQEPYYLLREEEGKVYVLCQDNRIANNYNPDSGNATENLSEFKLYDFTLSAGESIEFPSCSWDVHPDAERHNYYVNVFSPIDIDGERCRVMALSREPVDDPDYDHTFPVRIIEGIGATYNGSLVKFCLDMFGSIFDHSYEPTYYASLNRVLDADGNVVYGDGSAPPSDNWAFREDWVWKYCSESYDELAYIEKEKTCNEFEMRFDGVTDIDGHSWHNFKKTRSTEINYQWDADADEYVVVSSRDLECGETFLIRDEGGRYFMRLPEGDNLGYNYESWWKIDGDEAPLYDFNCREGESFMSVSCDGTAESFDVESVSAITIDGMDLKVFNAGSRPVIEGIGYIRGGILPYGTFSVPIGAPGAGPDIVSIEDLDGNVVFTPEMLNGGGSVDGVFAGSLTLRQEGNLVSAASDSDATVTIEVVGVDGAKRMAVAGRGAATADLSTLATGVYVVRATDGHDVKTLKVMIND